MPSPTSRRVADDDHHRDAHRCAASASAANTGVSVIARRTHRPTSTTPARNGSRQPHAKLLVGQPARQQQERPPAMMNPTGAPSCGNMP